MTQPRTSPAARTENTERSPDAQSVEEPDPTAAKGPGDTDARVRFSTRDTAPTPSLTDLRHHLTTHLDPPARTWLGHALDEAAAHPGLHGPISVWELRLAEAGRRCGPAYADAARVLILAAASADADALTRVYSQGTADERRAVLHALPHLVSGPDALPLVEDALRTNDTRLIGAALGPYAARYLTAHVWRHAVLKCLFTGVPVDDVADLPRRAAGDGELARMLGDYAAERTAAGRTVPEDLYRVLDLTESVTPASGTDHPHGKES
ncbi:EboA domain-containing protein [Streptomyces sp. NRRL B-1140]|uniref:EboA domain-containing protein n=1 Tax=Streptomyces sp. NRRL B-1140 TaxID=1415549 RepID=UPI0007C64FB4|nr:EboA domain-containing protein [Streptomyces sp. NRRL B-1140]